MPSVTSTQRMAGQIRDPCALQVCIRLRRLPVGTFSVHLYHRLAGKLDHPQVPQLQALQVDSRKVVHIRRIDSISASSSAQITTAHLHLPGAIVYIWPRSVLTFISSRRAYDSLDSFPSSWRRLDVFRTPQIYLCTRGRLQGTETALCAKLRSQLFPTYYASTGTGVDGLPLQVLRPGGGDCSAVGLGVALQGFAIMFG